MVPAAGVDASHSKQCRETLGPEDGAAWALQCWGYPTTLAVFGWGRGSPRAEEAGVGEPVLALTELGLAACA